MSKAAGPTNNKKRKENKRYTPFARMPNQLRVGDWLVISLNSDGTVNKSVKVEDIRRGEHCRNYHINRSVCYHRHLAVMVSIKAEDVEQMKASTYLGVTDPLASAVIDLMFDGVEIPA